MLVLIVMIVEVSFVFNFMGVGLMDILMLVMGQQVLLAVRQEYILYFIRLHVVILSVSKDVQLPLIEEIQEVWHVVKHSKVKLL